MNTNVRYASDWQSTISTQNNNITSDLLIVQSHFLADFDHTGVFPIQFNRSDGRIEELQLLIIEKMSIFFLF